MPYFESMVVRYPACYRIDEGAALEPVIVRSRDSLGVDRVARKHTHERVESLGVEAVGCRELPEKRTGLRAECQDAAREEISQRALTIAQFEIVRDEAASLDCEHEALIGHRLRPSLKDGR